MFEQRGASGTDAEALTPEQKQLLRLNFDFLKLLRDSTASAAPGAQRQQLTLPAAQSTSLKSCSDEGLQRMSQCGFALFSLSLHRADIWQHAARTDVQGDSQYAVPAATSSGAERSGFMACALFFAWHLSQQAPRTARFLLGMSDDCVAVIAALELWQCSHIAHSHRHLLGPRWQHHSYFWPDLLRYGATGEMQHFKFARLLGSQLMAQELEPSAIMRLSSTD
jgi:hypothetical protein